MRRRQPVVVAVLGFVCAAVLAGAVVHLAGSGQRNPPVAHGTASASPTPSAASARAIESCATSASAELSVGQVEGFRLFLTEEFDSAPITSLPNSSPALDVRDYLRSRTVGYVIDAAYQAPWLQQSQEYQKEMGYRVTSGPSFPLQGGIVEAMPGVLEIYQTDTVFSTPAAAAEWQQSSTYGFNEPSEHAVHLAVPLSGVVAYLDEESDPAVEDQYNVNLVAGDLQISMIIKGGKQIPQSQVDNLTDDAVSDIDRSCHLNILGARPVGH